jgi:hypothetical protein
MAAFVGRDVAKLKSKGGKWKYMSEKEMQEISDRFAPYRSVFMVYLPYHLEHIHMTELTLSTVVYGKHLLRRNVVLN